jgi:hypothetical protein
MKGKLTTQRLCTYLFLGLLLAAPVALQDKLTQAANTIQKAGEDASPQKKEVRIEDVTVREGDQKVRVKPGFEFVRVSRNEATVRMASAPTKGSHEVVLGSYRCSCNDSGNSTGYCDGENYKDLFVCVPQGCRTCKLIVP